MTTPDLAEEIRALRHGAGAVRIARDVVWASGTAAVDYLQGQLSQDVAALGAGESAWTFVLQPQGKVDVWFRVTRVGDDAYLLDTDPGWGDALLARLERFKLRMPVDLEPLDWSGVAVRGAGAGEPAAPDGGVVVAVDLPGDRGWDLLGPSAEIPAGLTECSAEALEALRVEAGLPRMGPELDDSTIPAESGVVPLSVSFTKGCYTGQELVARIDSRGGRTPRRLVGLRLPAGAEAPSPGAPLEIGGDEVGRVTSVAALGSHGGPVALAYLARGTETPAEVDTIGTSDTVTATALDLPLVDHGTG